MTSMVNYVNISRLLALGVLMLVITSTLTALSCSPERYLRKPESIIFGAIPSGSAALVYIAQDQGFFKAENLVVSVRDYPTGVATTEALLIGEVDIAWSAEFPMLSRAFAGEELSIFAVTSRFSDQYLFGLRDHGIDDISDLRGKTLGIPINTIAEFYLARFLELNGMNIQEVTIKNVLPPQSVETLSGGSVDGVVTWEPYTSIIKDQKADNIVAWPIQSSQPGFGIIIGRNDWIIKNPETISQFLKSLVKAEEYMIQNTEKAKNMVQERVDYDHAFMEIFWSESPFSISLDQSLIIAMEDEARWMIANNLTIEKKVPNFLDYIYEYALNKVKPEAVNIIR